MLTYADVCWQSPFLAARQVRQGAAGVSPLLSPQTPYESPFLVARQLHTAEEDTDPIAALFERPRHPRASAREPPADSFNSSHSSRSGCEQFVTPPHAGGSLLQPPAPALLLPPALSPLPMPDILADLDLDDIDIDTPIDLVWNLDIAQRHEPE
jgi:hypothetical protein